MIKIFTEQLKEDARQSFEVSFPGDFLELHEQEIQTPSPVAVKGEAYVLDELLMLTFDIATEIDIPCSICNKATRVPLQNKNILISLPLAELPSSIYDPSDVIREEVVMLIPQFVECQKGACPERKALDPYLKHEKKNFPFADL